MTATASMIMRQKLLDAFFRASQSTPPAQMYVALTRKVPPSNATGAQLDEPVGASYVRARYDLGTSNWDSTTFGEVRNSQNVLWPTATGSWGTIVGWALVDAATGGNVYAVGTLTKPLKIGSGTNPLVSPGGLIVGLSDA